ncbi:unnamed protein product [Bursaphelenchus xylophilus]|uniref:(pine wood nematode) hypothetical protein n=1 Tax=Bursaphelenchus xylophilus TaxID=6326 RepID=A0A1I7RJA6_BURXY|nr:unnamed protein product [Bursaphelenchus xylophilus]CAG9128745.1 unnamed protein product [Bursaphelenchus xylophilus]
MSDASGGGSELMQHRQIELERRIENFSSLDYTEFHASSRRHVREKSALFKALCHFEDELVEELDHPDAEQENTEKLTRVYTHLGHVHLLALDWIKALSAYQKAYKLAGSAFPKDESCLYGLGLSYFHFRLYKP